METMYIQIQEELEIQYLFSNRFTWDSFFC